MAAATAAIGHIDFQLKLWSWLETVYYGISLGSVLLLAAAGLAITFGVMGVINMAHGEMVMIGAYVTFCVQQVFRAYAPDFFGTSVIVAIPAAFLVAGAIGVLIERCMIRFLYGRPLETLLATWGLSLILQQAIRSLFGAENQNVASPGWMSGYFMVGGLTITVNRLCIIIFAFAVVGGLMAVMRYTPLGLRMRAVTQNRRMAASMGIATPWIDAMTFGLGSGIAGVAGVALSQIDNVSLTSARTTSSTASWSWSSAASAISGARCSPHSPSASSTKGWSRSPARARQDRRPRSHHPVHPEAPARLVPGQGTGGGSMTRLSLTLTPVIIIGVAILLAILNLSTPPTSALHVSDFVVGLAGKYLCYAMLALAVDLVWGFAGILTLGHAAFFALGGYCMGMYLTREIGARGVYANANLPDFMIFIGWKQIPWYWHGFEWFPFAIVMALIVPAVLAAVFGFLAFRSRVGGVYLSIITQALTYALLLAFFRNDMGFGGNNGMTDFKDIAGFPLNRSTTTTALMVISALFTSAAFLFARWLVGSRYGQVLVAVRDAESRTRFLGYRPEYYKPSGLDAVGDDRGHRRRAVRAAGRHHQPGRIRPRQLHRGGDLGRRRRARHADGRHPRRGAGELRQDGADRRTSRRLALCAGWVVHPCDAVHAARHHGHLRPPRSRGAGLADRA